MFFLKWDTLLQTSAHGQKFLHPSAWIPILYAGIMSCGVGYTGQIIGQKGMNPTVASLLLSLESVFSVLAGWIILGETMGLKQLCGCGLIFIAIVLAQLPLQKPAKYLDTNEYLLSIHSPIKLLFPL